MARLCLILTTIITALCLRSMFIGVAERKRILKLQEVSGDGITWQTVWNTVMDKYTLSFLKFCFNLLYTVYVQLTIANLIIFILKYLPAGLLIYSRIKYAYLSSRARVKDKQNELSDIELQIHITNLKLCVRHADLEELSNQLQRDTKELSKIIDLVQKISNVNKELGRTYNDSIPWCLKHNLYLCNTKKDNDSFVTSRRDIIYNDYLTQPQIYKDNTKKNNTKDIFQRTSSKCFATPIVSTTYLKDTTNVTEKLTNENEIIDKKSLKQYPSECCYPKIQNNSDNAINTTTSLHNHSIDASNHSSFALLVNTENKIDKDEYNDKTKVIKFSEKSIPNNELKIKFTDSKLLPNGSNLCIKKSSMHSEFLNILSISEKRLSDNSIDLAHYDCITTSKTFTKNVLNNDDDDYQQDAHISKSSLISHQSFSDSNKHDKGKLFNVHNDNSINYKTLVSKERLKYSNKGNDNATTIGIQMSNISNISKGIISRSSRAQYNLNKEEGPIYIVNRSFSRSSDALSFYNNYLSNKNKNYNRIEECSKCINDILEKISKTLIVDRDEITNILTHIYTSIDIPVFKKSNFYARSYITVSPSFNIKDENMKSIKGIPNVMQLKRNRPLKIKTGCINEPTKETVDSAICKLTPEPESISSNDDDWSQKIYMEKNTVAQFARYFLKTSHIDCHGAMRKANTFHDINQIRKDYEHENLKFKVYSELKVTSKAQQAQRDNCVHNNLLRQKEWCHKRIVSKKAMEETIGKATELRSRNRNKETKPWQASAWQTERLQYSMLYAQRLMPTSNCLHDLHTVDIRLHLWPRLGRHQAQILAPAPPQSPVAVRVSEEMFLAHALRRLLPRDYLLPRRRLRPRPSS